METFESYVILDTTKTMTINVEGWLRREDKKLRIISVFLIYSSFSPFKFVLEFLALTIQEKLIAKNRLTKKVVNGQNVWGQKQHYYNELINYRILIIICLVPL